MIDPFAAAAGWLHENWLLPVLYQLDMMEWDDIAYGWVLFALYGVAQVLLMLAVCWPMEKWRRLENWPNRSAVSVDIFYTLLNRIGVMPLVTFVLFYQLQVWLSGALTDHGYVPPTLEGLVPWLMGRQAVTFVIYVLILDCADYWRHRLSHNARWWYALHAVHHAQKQMTFWSDDRNHVLDDLIAFVWFLALGLLIGIPPMQFPLVILVLRFLESMSHVNARVNFGWLGDRLLISPRFHRAHHGILAAGQRSCNYGAIFPFWDMLFRTADFSRAYAETGDPSAEAAMVSGSWWEQQVAGFRRLLRRKGPRPGARPLAPVVRSTR
jgi:sterol desaturase/sphingolipid hydroxylase (fatty acid hydroxylase superfamily)